MITTLNLTLKLKQDAASIEKIEKLKSTFVEKYQGAINDAMRDFAGVHFARVLIIHNQYLLVLTEFDGEKTIYADFFRIALKDFFKEVFCLAEGNLDVRAVDNSRAFLEIAQTNNIKPLGKSLYKDNNDGFMYMAQDQVSVRDITRSLKLTEQLTGLRNFWQS